MIAITENQNLEWRKDQLVAVRSRELNKQWHEIYSKVLLYII